MGNPAETGLFTYIAPLPSVRVHDAGMSSKKGALAGKSFTIQPGLSVRGWPTDAGSVALKGFVAVEDATMVERLRRAGAVLAGSSRMSEFGFGLADDTTGRILSAGLSDLAIMTDMTGEARITAARSGVFAFKPSCGILSRFGLIGLAPSLECPAVLARTPQDIAAAMEITAGDDGRDYSLSDGGTLRFDSGAEAEASVKTIGVMEEPAWDPGEAELRAYGHAREKMKRAGYAIREVRHPDYRLFRAVHHCIGAVEASSSCGKYDGVRYGHRTAAAKNWNEMYLKTRSEVFGPLVKAYLFQGAYFQFENYRAFENACRIRARLVAAINRLFAEVDALAFPTRVGGGRDQAEAAPRDLYNGFVLTLPANVAGIPAVQIPGFCIDGDCDYGLQLFGPRLSDAALLLLAARMSGAVQGD